VHDHLAGDDDELLSAGPMLDVVGKFTTDWRGSLDGSPIPARYPGKPVQAKHGFSSRGTPQSRNAAQHGRPP